MAGGLLSSVWVVARVRGDGRAHPIATLLILRQRLVPEVYRCIYCGETGESFLTSADDPDHPSRRVELCRNCGDYLKNVDAKTRTPFELLPVADLATSDLDVGAAGRGYTRPRCQTWSPYNRSSR